MPPFPAATVHYEVLRSSESWTIFRDLTPESIRPLLRTSAVGLGTPLLSMASSHPVTYALFRSLVLYEDSGQQVIAVGPRMQRAMAETDLRGVPPDRVRLPYDCFYLALPDCEWSLWDGSATGWHRVGGVYVYREPTDPRVLCVFCWGRPNDHSTSSTDDAVLWFTLDLDAKHPLDTQLLTSPPDVDLKDSVVGRVERDTQWIRNPKSDLDALISYVFSDSTHDISDAGCATVGPDADAILATVQETARNLLRVIVNTVLYINSTAPELSGVETFDWRRVELENELRRKKAPKSPRAKKLRSELERLSRARWIWVGPQIERAPANRETSAGGSPADHWRRGYWNYYHTGPKKTADGTPIPTNRRPICMHWIPPQWVGLHGTPPSPSPSTYGVREPAVRDGEKSSAAT
jgi:hypothetical protein